MTNVKDHFLRVQKVFDRCCASYKFSSIGSKRTLEKKTFQKKALFPVTKDPDPRFLALSSVINLREQSVSVHKNLWQLMWKS